MRKPFFCGISYNYISDGEKQRDHAVDSRHSISISCSEWLFPTGHFLNLTSPTKNENMGIEWHGGVGRWKTSGEYCGRVKGGRFPGTALASTKEETETTTLYKSLLI